MPHPKRGALPRAHLGSRDPTARGPSAHPGKPSQPQRVLLPVSGFRASSVEVSEGHWTHRCVPTIPRVEESAILLPAEAPQQPEHPCTHIMELPEIKNSVIYWAGHVAITLLGDIAVYSGTSKIQPELIMFWRMIFSSYLI